MTAEDLDTRELVYDGADAATMVPDDPATPVDAAYGEEVDADEVEADLEA